MAAKHWIGLIALVLFINSQVRADGSWFNLDPASAAADEAGAGVTCFSPDDCLKDECCLSNVRPIGKRSARTKRWFITTTPSEGVCQKLGTFGSSCIVPFSGIFPDPRKEVIAMDSCPCATEFNCDAGPDAPIDVPQGKIGSCEVKEAETQKAAELLQLLSEREEDEVGADNDDAETDNDAPSDEFKVDNNDNQNADSLLEKEELTKREEEEQWEEEQPMGNTFDDFPEDPEA